MPRVVTAPERALLASPHYVTHVRVELEAQSGLWQDVSALNARDFLREVRWKDLLDTPVMSGSITLARVVRAQSIAPTVASSPINHPSGGAYAPFIRGGQRVRIKTADLAPGVAPVDADFREVFLGKVDDPSWGDKANALTLAIADEGAWLLDTFIKEERPYGSEAGMPVETVMQQILDDNPVEKLGPVALYVPVASGMMVRTYQQAKAPILQALRDLAFQIGWDVRYRYDAAGEFRLTFFSPDRARSVIDWTFGPSEYVELPDIKENSVDVRNAGRVRYVDAATGDIGTAEYSVPSSIAIYGERYIEVNEDKTGNVDSAVEATRMVTAMISDLAFPLIAQSMSRFYFMPVQLGDNCQFLPNAMHYDEAQVAAVVSIEHALTRESRRTTLGVRGKPAGAYAGWLQLASESHTLPVDESGDTRALALKNFREIRRTPTTVTYGWDAVSADVAEIWIWGKLSPQDVDPPLPAGDDEDRLWRDIVADPPDSILERETRTFDVHVPDFGFVQTWELQPVSVSDERGYSQRVKVLSVPDIPRISSIKTVVGASGLFVDITELNVVDPQALGGTLRAWLNHTLPDDVDPNGAPDGVASVVTTPYTFGVADVFTLTSGGTFQLLDNVRIHAGAGKRVVFEFINSHGVSSGKITFVLLGGGAIITPDGELADESINRAQQVASSHTLPSVYDVLPGAGRPNELALLTTDMKVYRWDGSGWTAQVPATDVSGILTRPQLADAIIDMTKIAPTIAVPERVAGSLPASPGTGRIALYGNELWRSTADGTGWTKSVPSADLTGFVARVQIATNAVNDALLDTDAVTTPKIKADAVVSNKILAGNIVTLHMTANTINGSVVTADTLHGSKITSLSVDTGQLAAFSIVAGKIGVGAVNTDELHADAVVSNKIGANQIVTLHMQVNTINGDRITTNTFNANKITTGTLAALTATIDAVTAGVLTAASITGTAIHSGSIDTLHIATIVLSEVKPGTGIIQIGKLMSADGQRYLDLAASGSLPFLHHPSLDLRADGSAQFGGVVSASSFTAGTATFTGYIVSKYFTAQGTLSQFMFSGDFGSDQGGPRLYPRDPSGIGAQANYDLVLVGKTDFPVSVVIGNVLKQSGAGSNINIKPIPGVTVTNVPPGATTGFKQGDLWVDSFAMNTYVFDAGAWAQASH